ncbi:MAG: CvpA family protein [Oscillospiraceae bacterium]|nr:CvpA family protein [Oscillospiraceae bacterium]
MNKFIPLIYDIISISLCLLLVLKCYKNGFMNTLLKCIKYFLVIIVYKIFIDKILNIVINIFIEYNIQIKTDNYFFKLILSLIILIILNYIFGLIFKLIDRFINFSFMGELNRIFGGIVGILYSSFLLSLVCFGLKTVVYFTNDNLEYLNESIINSTFFLNFFYNFNFFML